MCNAHKVPVRNLCSEPVPACCLMILLSSGTEGLMAVPCVGHQDQSHYKQQLCVSRRTGGGRDRSTLTGAKRKCRDCLSKGLKSQTIQLLMTELILSRDRKVKGVIGRSGLMLPSDLQLKLLFLKTKQSLHWRCTPFPFMPKYVNLKIILWRELSSGYCHKAGTPEILFIEWMHEPTTS